ncbi:large ribosomal subunit protein mL49-like [Lineus longissimus]|uniref:large ribosomal subunit protein mL49-like n=1 Tax=Lineus longissimus TaxID=88925 RepID=UPI002B4C7FCB
MAVPIHFLARSLMKKSLHNCSSVIKSRINFVSRYSRGCSSQECFYSTPPGPRPVPHSEFEKAKIDLDYRENIEVEEIDDPEAFKWVEKLIPNPIVPEPPQHEKYPTPSGWIPQTAKPGDLPYFVRRSRFHNIPVYLEHLKNNTVKCTKVLHIDGDIWVLEAELSEHLKSLRKKGDKPIITQVHEVGRFIIVNGIHVEPIVAFLLSKGL